MSNSSMFYIIIFWCVLFHSWLGVASADLILLAAPVQVAQISTMVIHVQAAKVGRHDHAVFGWSL